MQIALRHFGRNFSRVIARTKNDHMGAGDVLQQAFEIAVRGNQDEVIADGIVQNHSITGAGEPVS